MKKEEERQQWPEGPTPVEQYAKEIEATPLPPGGDVFVAHLEESQPRTPPSSTDSVKHELWQQLVDNRKIANVSQAAVAERIGISQTTLNKFEHRGIDHVRLTTIRRYLDELTGWSSPIQAATGTLDRLRRWDRLTQAKIAAALRRDASVRSGHKPTRDAR